MSTKYPQGLINGTPPYTTGNFSGVWTLEQLAKNYYFFGDGVSNSLRFRSSASAYLTRTESAGNRTTWTLSYWFKLSPAFGCMFGFGDNSTGGTDVGPCLQYNVTSTGSGDFRFSEAHGGVNSFFLAPTLVIRDYSAWYHLVIAVDTTQATASNRIKMYLNGAQITSFSTATYPSQNFATAANQAGQSFRLGCIDVDGSVGQYFDGYMAEVNFIDGQALTPSSFGVVAPATGVWSPKRYSGSYGLNGFYLNFSNGTSTTTLGNDSSGNSNNWTTNNISLTAGSTYDWMIDSPTPFQGSSYGVGNYAVLNPLDSGGATVADGNLTCNQTGADSMLRGSFGVSSGKWYWEATLGNTKANIGIAKSNAALSNYLGSDANGWGYYSITGQKINSGSLTSYGATYTTGDVIGVAFDADAGTLTFYKNNVSQGVAFTGLTSGPYFPAQGTSASLQYFNFGQRPFAYTPPTGYKSLCTFNLPTPTIQNGANYMAATTYTGTGSSLSVSNAVNSVSFQPDLVWIKSRSAATDHALYDVIRGTQNRLESNTTDAAVAADNGLTAFGSAGFTVNTLAQVNTSAATYIGWQWKAGGTAVSNNAGSITSQVSANTTAGFSVVTYTGTGANATVGHGLGVAPSMMIFKVRSTTNSWLVYHASVGATAYLLLDSTAASATSALAFNNTAPTSSVATISTGNAVNQSSQTYVAYCFAAIPGYSAFGSYTGNGSADGPFVYCGFRPRYVLIKNASDTFGWDIFDTSRSTYNEIQTLLYANTSGAETTNAAWGRDILSNGFKIRNNGQVWNQNGNTYIYAAFAENPFKYSLAR